MILEKQKETRIEGVSRKKNLSVGLNMLIVKIQDEHTCVVVKRTVFNNVCRLLPAGGNQ